MVLSLILLSGLAAGMRRLYAQTVPLLAFQYVQAATHFVHCFVHNFYSAEYLICSDCLQNML
ncbi:hypothetical protein A7D25_04540 [Pseudomonas sp. 21C1]|nr:hypothetical protein A7D25_04540 [Pseudomonas sp. 21C1]